MYYFLLCGLVTALINLWANAAQYSIIILLSKPVPIVCFVFVVFVVFHKQNSGYSKYILYGLIASLVGDIWLLFPAEYFTSGLVSFFIAHIFYILAMRSEIVKIYPRFVILMLIIASCISASLWGSLGVMKYPVMMYIGIITIMSILALSLAYSNQHWPKTLIAPAALLFFVSDAFLALNRFVLPIPYSGLFVMTTYYFAQFLIVLSALDKKDVMSIRYLGKEKLKSS